MSKAVKWIRQTNWNAGEVDETQYRRTDNKLYLQAAQRLKNVIVSTTGLLDKRLGFKNLLSVSEYAGTTSVMFPYIDKNLTPYIVLSQPLQFHIFKYNKSADTLTYQTTVSHPYNNSQLRELDLDLAFDVLVFTHPLHEQARLYISDYTTTTFTYEPLTISPKPSYDFNKINYNDFNVSYSVASKVLTFKFEGLSEDPGFNDDWVGGSIVGAGDDPKGGLGYAIITAVSYSAGVTTFTANIEVPFASSDPKPKGSGYSIRQPLFTSKLGYPAHVMFYQNRLWFANTATMPDGLFGSQLGAFANMDVGTGLPTDAIIELIGGQDSSGIVSINGGKQLEIFTEDAEYIIPQPEGQGLKPNGFQIIKQTSFGSQSITKPVNYQNDTYYIGKGGNTVNIFQFNGIGESYSSETMNPQSTSLIKNPVNRALKQADNASQDSFIYYLNSDHTIGSFQFAVGANFGAISELTFQDDVEVHDILSLNNKIFVLKSYRKTQNYVIERMVDTRDIFQDGMQSATMNADGEITGLSLYNGYTLNVVYDGQDFGEYVVDEGMITVDNQGKSGAVTVGLLYDVKITSMDLFLFPQFTNAYKKLLKIMVGYYDSIDFRVNGKQVPFQTFKGIQAGEGITPKTGTYIVGDTRAYSRNSGFNISQHSPFDLHVQSIQYKVSGGLV